MRKIFPILVATFVMAVGAGQAQTTPSPLSAPPAGTLSTTRTEKTIGSDGTLTKTNETTYRNTNGVADDTVTQTTTIAPPPVTTTTEFSTTTTTIKK